MLTDAGSLCVDAETLTPVSTPPPADLVARRTESRRTAGHTLALAAPYIGVAVLLAQFALTAAYPSRYQIDLRPYLAVHASGAGLHPEDLYPPYRPMLLSPLALLPPLVSYYAYLVIRTAVLFLALGMCLRFLSESGGGERGSNSAADFKAGLFLLFAVFGFNGALGFDLRIGNVATVELWLLLLAFDAYLRDRLGLFVALVLLAGSMKVLPFAFLGLLAFSSRAESRRYLLIGAAGIVALLAAPLVLDSRLLHGLQRIAGSYDSLRGPIDESSRALCLDAARLSKLQPLHRELGWCLYGLLSAGILLASVRPMRRLHANRAASRSLISLFILTYVLVTPRMVTYSYTLAVLPIYYLGLRSGWSRSAKILVIAACMPTQALLWHLLGRDRGAPVESAWLLPIEYWHWIVVFAAWLYAVRQLRAVEPVQRLVEGLYARSTMLTHPGGQASTQRPQP